MVLNGVPIPVTTGVRFRGTQDTGPRHEKFTYWDYMFDLGLKGEMGEIGRLFQDVELGNGLPLQSQRGDGFVRR